MPKKQAREVLILVGFGKKDLIDLVEKIGTPEEDELIRAPLNTPPRYRRKEICTPEEIGAFVQYATLCQKKLMQGEI